MIEHMPMDHLVLQRLFSRARGGDQAAETELFEYLFVRFVYLAKRRIGEEEAEDIAQDACTTILRKFRTETGVERLDIWAYGVLKRKIGNFYQRRETRRKIINESGDVDDMTGLVQTESNPELRRKLVVCLRKLIVSYPRYARILNLVYQGYSTEEICRRLKVKPGNMYVMLNRGRKLLSDCLEGGND
ncbi:MAG: RNA polymerase sigma factor [candidate division Zixibacteria bacterium]|nr:RNA polymerase sigma factor [candidate division Zixibacteria bacterium]